MEEQAASPLLRPNFNDALGRLDAMPDTLRGFHAPGSISFFDHDDPCLDADGAVERQAGEIAYVYSDALARIDAGDW